MKLLWKKRETENRQSEEAVDELTNRLVQDGDEVISGPRTTGDGYFERNVVYL